MICCDIYVPLRLNTAIETSWYVSYFISLVIFQEINEWLNVLLGGLPEVHKPMIMPLEISGMLETACAVKAKLLHRAKTRGDCTTHG